jgi:organic hydroperoxide reductase OsmC/OhrA
MSEHHAEVHWTRTSPDFTYDSYNRSHAVTYKSGAVKLPGSAAVEFKGDGKGVDPEEQFVASLSACHMLSFLAIAARKRLTVESYDDHAVGILERRSDGKFWMARVTLRPSARFGAPMPEPKTVNEIHHLAHETCFIANSVNTSVAVEPQL